MGERGAFQPDPLEVVSHQADHYQRYCCRNARAHYISSDAYQHRHFWVGVPAIVLSAVVGTTIFASLSSNGHFELKVAAGILSVLAATLTALQTFMSFDDKAKEHKLSGNKFSALRQEFELYLLILMDGETQSYADRVQSLKILTDKFSNISSEAPKVPERVWRQANKEVPVRDAHLSRVALAVARRRLDDVAPFVA